MGATDRGRGGSRSSWPDLGLAKAGIGSSGPGVRSTWPSLKWTWAGAYRMLSEPVRQSHTALYAFEFSL
eukprot:11165821-Lingulodinium_polyedra.AAC.1